MFRRVFRCFNGKHFLFDLREDTIDFDAVQSIMVHDEYGFKDFKFNDGDIIINIGAYIGEECVYFAGLDKEVKVYAYEPVPENVEMIKKNLENNVNSERVKVFQMAVSDKDGFIEMNYGSSDIEIEKKHCYVCSAMIFDKEVERKKVVVPCITLESIFKRNNIKKCKLLKIDCEGCEIKAFKNCPKCIFEKIDWIVGEHHNIKREELLSFTKGVFIDEPCQWQSDGSLGHFRFKNKKL